MSPNGWLQIAVFVGLLTLLARPVGVFVADVMQGRRTFLSPALAPLERLVYRLTGVDPESESDWRTYALGMLAFNLLGVLVVYAVERLQHLLPLNPQHLGAVPPGLAMNTAVSFATNTNWQNYGGESTMSYFTQMTALAVQNFVCVASALGVLAALFRGLSRHSAQTVGNFWADLTRSTLYVLLPLSALLALALVSQGAVQSFAPYAVATRLEAVADTAGHAVTTQTLPLGPAASQIAIKMLGTNGGGFFNANSAHPFENPTPLSNFLEMLAIFLLPAGLCLTFGRWVGDERQGWAVYSAMLVLFLGFLALAVGAETRGTPPLAALGVQTHVTAGQSGGTMEGKETRFGVVNSALFATITTSASCGAVNSMHDSMTPLGGLVPIAQMQLGEVIFGGVGSGLYGMLVFAILTVFMAGLMVGRTPEYLGKKIEAFEMKMSSLAVLLPSIAVLTGTAIAVMVPSACAVVGNPGPHGFSEILYAFSSAANNNGSAFAGLGSNTTFYNFMLAMAMLIGRFWVKVPVLAIAGSLGRKKRVPAGSGTLATHTPLFVAMLVGVVIIVGALTFLPALALGPIVEHLNLHAQGVAR